METKPIAGIKQNDASNGSQASGAAQKLGEMLSRADYGLHVTGRIDSIGDVDHKSGTSAKGTAYSFYQQVITLTLGGSMVEVGYRSDTNPTRPLCSHKLDDIVRLKVSNPRIYNGKVSFDIAD